MTHVQALSAQVSNEEAIAAAAEVIEAGKAVKAARRRCAELRKQLDDYQDNQLTPAMQRFRRAQARFNELAALQAGFEEVRS